MTRRLAEVEGGASPVVALARSTQMRVDRIVVGRRLRSVRPEVVEQLARSIREVGLLHPVVVTADGELVAGLHRLEAVRSLGLVHVAVTVVSEVERDRLRLAEIDENLVRSELTELERAEHVAERKRVYEALHPAAPSGQGGDRRSTETVSVDRRSFAADTAAKTGRTERSVRLDVQVGNLPEPVRDAIRSTPVADRKRDLVDLARLEADEQAEVAAAVAEGAPTVAAAVEVVRRKAIFPPPGERVVPPAIQAAPAVPNLVDLRLGSCADVEWPVADLVIADPPWKYRQKYGAAAPPYPVLTIADIVRHLTPLRAGRLALWCTWPVLPELLQALQFDGWPWKWVTGGSWLKSDGRSGHYGPGHHWAGCSEPVLVYTRRTRETYNSHKALRNCWTSEEQNSLPGAVAKRHSTKPAAWMAQWITRWVPPGGLVLDPYAGLGSVAKAVLLAGGGRRYLGAEIDATRHAEALVRIAARAAEVAAHPPQEPPDQDPSTLTDDWETA